MPHLAYHVGNLHELEPLDAVAQPIALAATLVLAVPLCLPPRRGAVGGIRTVTDTETEGTGTLTEGGEAR